MPSTTFAAGAPARSPPRRPRRRQGNLARIALGALAVLAAPVAFAAPTSWSCWYDGEAGILCVAAGSPPSNTAAVQTPAQRPRPDASAAGVPVFEATAGDRSPRWPWKIVRIPILTIPTDIEGLRPLAIAILCGRQRDCTVHLDALPDADAIVAALDDD